jgi:hypothetical protein
MLNSQNVEGLTEYEIERAKKIAANKAMLAELGLDKKIISSIVCLPYVFVCCSILVREERIVAKVLAQEERKEKILEEIEQQEEEERQEK